ncbi:hypothetical protein D3C86_1755940 [compost metagenome]
MGPRYRLGDFFTGTCHVTNGQGHVVGAQWIGDVDDHLRAQISQALQRLCRITVSSRNDHYITVPQRLGCCVCVDVWKPISQGLRFFSIATSDSNSVAGVGKLLGES